MYKEWPVPDVIISDGGYGVSGFKGDVIWEPFGGLCTAGLAAYTKRAACCAEIDEDIFQMAADRLEEYDRKLKLQPRLLETFLSYEVGQ